MLVVCALEQKGGCLERLVIWSQERQICLTQKALSGATQVKSRAAALFPARLLIRVCVCVCVSLTPSGFEAELTQINVWLHR